MGDGAERKRSPGGGVPRHLEPGGKAGPRLEGGLRALPTGRGEGQDGCVGSLRTVVIELKGETEYRCWAVLGPI